MMAGPAANGIRFDDGAAYERFMGRWSRAAGARFLDWIDPPPQARWLDVGCGTGAFTQLVSERCQAAAIVAIDPAAAQIAYARRTLDAGLVEFHIAAGETMPWQDATFDIVASALAINFMQDRLKTVREMARVARAGGMVAGYVWDFAARCTPRAPLVRALRRVGVEAPAEPGDDGCALTSLRSLFAASGLIEIETTAFDIVIQFADVAAFWTAQSPGFSPTTRLIARLDGGRRARLNEALHAEVSTRPDGSIAYSARANAVKARVAVN
jgi:SAM-dependent methyltransferase